MLTALVDYFAPPSTVRLSEDDVWRLIEGSDDLAILQAWRSFGDLLLQDARDGAAGLDTKAHNLLAWAAAGVVAGVEFARQADTLPDATALTAACVGAAGLALVAAVAGYRALRVVAAQTPSQLAWFNNQESVGAARLQRYHLLEIHRWLTGELERGRAKGAWLIVGQRCLGAAMLLLFVLAVLVRV